MINVIPIQGPNGAISAATSSLLQQTILRHNDDGAANLLAQTLLTSREQGGSISKEGIEYDLSIINDKIRSLSSLINSINTDIFGLYSWLGYPANPGVAHPWDGIGGSNISFDNNYITQDSSGKYYSDKAKYLYYVYNGTPISISPLMIINLFDNYNNNNVDDLIFKHAHFKESSHGELDSILDDDVTKPLHKLATTSKPGFMGVTQFNNLSTLVGYFGTNNTAISNAIYNSLSGRISSAVLIDNNNNYGDLSYIGYATPDDRITYGSYNTWLKIAKTLSYLSNKIGTDANDYLLKGSGNTIPVFYNIVKYSNGVEYIVKRINGRWWLWNDFKETSYPDGTQIPIDKYHSLPGGIILYSYDVISTPNLKMPAGWYAPEESDWLDLVDDYDSFISDKYINTNSFNADKSDKNCGHVDDSGLFVQDNILHYWVNDSNNNTASQVLCDQLSSVSIHNNYATVNGPAKAKARFIINESEATIIQYRPDISSYSIQSVHNPTDFNNITQYYNPSISTSVYGDKTYDNSNWDLVVQGQLDEVIADVNTNTGDIVQIKQDIANIRDTGGIFIGQSFATFADLNSFVPPVGLILKEGDFTYVMNDEKHGDHISRYIYTGTPYSDPNVGTTSGFYFAYTLQHDVATNTSEGVVMGTADPGDGSKNGYVTVLNATGGTMKVIGWSDYMGPASYIESISGFTNDATAGALNLGYYTGTGYGNAFSSINVPSASTTKYGVVKVGDGLTIDSTTGTLKTTSSPFGGKSLTNRVLWDADHYTGYTDFEYDGSTDIMVESFDWLNKSGKVSNYSQWERRFLTALRAGNYTAGKLRPVCIYYHYFSIDTGFCVPTNLAWVDNITLPIATESDSGTVQIGDRITIDSSTGVISADPYTAGDGLTLANMEFSLNTGYSDPGTRNYAVQVSNSGSNDGKLFVYVPADTPYVLPAATETSLGGVIVGSNIAVAADGTISVAAPYSLPKATTTVLGGIIVGAGLSADNDGKLSATPYTLPKATDSALGGVMIDSDSNITIDSNGKISVAAPYTLPTASDTILGGIKIGSGLSINNGVVSATVQPYTLLAATDAALGGIKLGYTLSGKNYPIVLDSNSSAYVNVPWEDHTYTELPNPYYLTFKTWHNLGNTSTGYASTTYSGESAYTLQVLDLLNVNNKITNYSYWSTYENSRILTGVGNVDHEANSGLMKFGFSGFSFSNGTYYSALISGSAGSVQFPYATSSLHGTIRIGTGFKIDSSNYGIYSVDTIDNLTSTSTTSPLSANQGKVLKDAIDAIASVVIDGPYASTSAVTSPKANTIYLIGTSAPYSEYIYIHSTWELIGSTTTDLSNYYNKSEVDAKIPTELKNPNALTFTGASTSTYDGSTAVSVNIPTSGTTDQALTVDLIVDNKTSGSGNTQVVFDGSTAKSVKIPDFYGIENGTWNGYVVSNFGAVSHAGADNEVSIPYNILNFNYNDVITNSIITIPKAAASTHGTIRIGDGLSIDSSGILSITNKFGGKSLSLDLVTQAANYANNPSDAAYRLRTTYDGSTDHTIAIPDFLNASSNITDYDLWNQAFVTTMGCLSDTTNKGKVKMYFSEFDIYDGAWYDSSKYFYLPQATATEHGTIRVGSGLSIDSDGVLSSTGGGSYTLPAATTTTLGGVKVGSGLSVTADGTVSVGTTSMKRIRIKINNINYDFDGSADVYIDLDNPPSPVV